MSSSTTWRGRRGAVLLGPTEHRVARYLAELTAHGRAIVRTTELAERLSLSRSEAYRVTARLRALGLFGVRNDRGGTLGGRWYWRTATKRDGSDLDPRRHRIAWARVHGAARARAIRIIRLVSRGESGAPADAVPMSASAGASFRDLFAAAGGGALLEAWESA